MRQIHDFSGILAAHVRALIEAEAESAATTAEFIQQVGFEQDSKNPNRRQVRMMSFQLPRRNNEGGVSLHQIEIPLLSLLPVPLLTIEKAELNFDLTIEDIIQSDNSKDPNSVAPKKSPRLLTSIARKTPVKADQNTGSNKSNVDLTVKITLSQGDFPLGLEKLLQLADLSSLDQLVDKKA